MCVIKAGNYVKEHILSSFIRLIANSAELQTYCVQKLYSALKADITQEALTLAGAWTIGEYGDLLLKGGQYEEEELVVRVSESDIVDLLSTILTSAYATSSVREYIITALMKLTTRISSAAEIERIRRILHSYSDSLDVETQQRSVEYGNMFGYDEIRRGVLEKMPPPVIKEVSRVFEREAVPKPRAGKKAAKKQSDEEALLDLMGGEPSEPTAPLGGAPQNNMELLSGILSGDPMLSNSPSPPPSTQSNLNSIMDLFNTPGSSSPAPVAASQQLASSLLGGLDPAPVPPVAPAAVPAAAQVYNKNDLQITLQLARTADGTINIIARFKNKSFTDRITSVSLQAAVPKSMKLQLQPISGSELDPDAEATQMMRVAGNKGGVLKMRLKIGYVKDGVGNIMDMVDWAESP